MTAQSILYRELSLPISVKGVVLQNGQVALLKNEREEWELPGGKLDEGETPEQCVQRELLEETGWTVTPAKLLDVWVYKIRPGRNVLIVTYGCTNQSTQPPVVSREHKELAMFPPKDVPALDMPEGYKQSIQKWAASPS